MMLIDEVGSGDFVYILRDFNGHVLINQFSSSFRAFDLNQLVPNDDRREMLGGVVNDTC